MAKGDGVKGRFAVFCDYALTSADGKLSIIGEFEQLISTQGKPVLSKGFLVGSFRAEPHAKVEITVKLIDEKGNSLLPERTFNSTFGSNGGHNILLEINGLAFATSGIYKGQFLHQDKVLCEASIKVMEGRGNVSKGSTPVN